MTKPRRRNTARRLADLVRSMPHPIDRAVIVAAFPTATHYVAILTELGIVTGTPPTFTATQRARSIATRRQQAAQRAEERRREEIGRLEERLARLRDAEPTGASH